MIKAAGYPVMVDIGDNLGKIYSVYMNGKLIFTGQSIERHIDIAPLLRDYLNSERIIIDWPDGVGLVNATAQLSAGIAKVTVDNSSANTSIYVDMNDTTTHDYIPITDIPIGYNLRGKTIIFTNTDKDTASFVNNWDNDGGVTGWDSNNNRVIIYSTFDGGDGIYVFINREIIQIWKDGQWIRTSFTFPDDMDYLVDGNDAHSHQGDSWGFDYAIISASTIVANDYNNECNTDFSGEPYITSKFIRNQIDRRQICFFGANTSYENMLFDISLNHPELHRVRTLSQFVRTSIGGYNVLVDSGEIQRYEKMFTNPSVIIRTTLSLINGIAGTVVFNVKNQAGVLFDLVKVEVLKCTRYRYALYAVNRMGGVTHILCEGKPLQSYRRKSWDIETDYNRLSQVGRGIRRISTSTTRRWRINIGYLTEAEASEINDLVNSPRIVLHDLEAGRLFAVNSTDSTVDDKTYETNGRKPIEYTLNFEEARTEIRR